MIGILGGMGTHAGIDFCNKLAQLNKGKTDQQNPQFILYNKSDVPARTKNLKKYNKVLASLYRGCVLLKKNNCKFISIPCNTAHYWYDDLQNKIKIPIINMPEEVFKYCKRRYKKNSKIGILGTEGTLKTGIYSKFFNKSFELIEPNKFFQRKYVNTTIKLVKEGNIQKAEKTIKPAIRHLIKKGSKSIILGCTELPLALQKNKLPKNFIDANLILAIASMKKYKSF
mgnify:CR=1 FL=1|tara:strand:- start:333 stop:1013 length:681 start_codon:yes stop_codon:yes gene_type:complete